MTWSRRQFINTLLISQVIHWDIAKALSQSDEAHLQVELLMFKQPIKTHAPIGPTQPAFELPNFDLSAERVHPQNTGMLLNNAAAALRHQGYETLIHRLWELDAPPNARIGCLVNEPTFRTAIQIQRAQTLMLDFRSWVSTDNAQGVQIAETKRIKLNETHYFDNSVFGAIIQVRVKAQDNT